MSRKVKCINCANASSFAIPMSVSKANYDYAKHILAVIKNRLCCRELSRDKTKLLDNEQYCKHYRKRQFPLSIEDDVKKLEEMIAEYEKQLVS